jgi:hypothetical protein
MRWLAAVILVPTFGVPTLQAGPIKKGGEAFRYWACIDGEWVLPIRENPFLRRTLGLHRQPTTFFKTSQIQISRIATPTEFRRSTAKLPVLSFLSTDLWNTACRSAPISSVHGQNY